MTVYKLDRFSRNKFESVINRKKLSDNGVKVLSAMENIPDTPEGIILESLLEGMNQYFSAELSQKVKRGMRETRLKGYYQGGGLPYGYRVEDRKIVVNEEQAKNVRYMFEQFAKGVYVREIIEALTARGATYHGKPFAKNTEYNILKNEKYCGVYYHGEERIDNMYPQIVPDEIFERVRNITESNKHGKRSVEVTYLLRHKLVCGYCGQSVIAENGTARNGERRYYYKCRGRKARVNDYKKAAVPKEELERLVLDAVIGQLKKPVLMDKFVNAILAEQEKRNKENSALLVMQREQRQNEIALDNIMKGIEALLCDMYFADPYCAWQKGTNENLNGLLREFYPKGRNLSRVSPATLKKNLALLNARPKKVLHFRTPQDLFRENLAKCCT